jgi:hypothetical protein
MPTNLEDLTLDSVTPNNGFFNENEVLLMNNIMNEGSGVYRLIQDKLGQFTSATKVTVITEDGVTVTDGRITITGELEDVVYVNFVV